MTFQVRLARRAASYLQRLEPSTRDRIIDRLDQIANDPFGPYTKQLTNAFGRHAARVGKWRIIFTVDTNERIVGVSAIALRGEVYRDI